MDLDVAITAQPFVAWDYFVGVDIAKLTLITNMPCNLKIVSAEFDLTALLKIRTPKMKILNECLKIRVNWHQLSLCTIAKTTFHFILYTTIQTHDCILTYVALPWLLLRCHHTKTYSTLRVCNQVLRLYNLLFLHSLVLARRAFYQLRRI